MHRIKALFDSIRQRGIVATLSILFAQLIDFGFDLRHGTDTFSWCPLESLEIENENRERGTMYQPTRSMPLRQALRRLHLPPGGVFVDLGCGKGMALMVAAGFPFKAVRGVEFSSELCTIARRNCESYSRRRPRTPPIEVIEADVARYPIQDDETLFFMYNPFDDTVLGQVLDNIRDSLHRHPRTVQLLYHNAVHKAAIADRPEWRDQGSIVVWGNEYCRFTAESGSVD